MSRWLILFAVSHIIGYANHAQASGENWREITQSGLKAAPVDVTESAWTGTKPGADGDKLYITRTGDSLKSIALHTTGSRASTKAIADYNGLAVDAVLSDEELLFIPADLLLPANSHRQLVNWEIQEFGINGNQESVLPLPPVEQGFAVPEMTTPVIQSEKIDMFAGEVKVLGQVRVTRVAVGNGRVIRAEVLKTGELMIIAQSPGSSSVRLWNKDQTQSDFNIRVSESDPETRVRMERMVRMRVRMVEFRKSALGRLGIDWGDHMTGPTFATAGDLVGNVLFRPAGDVFSEGLPNTVKPFSTYFGIASNITSRINFLASTGDAVTLAEPVLSCTNGGTASFLAGGEVPYPSIGSNGQTMVQFKEYGIKLQVSPMIDAAGNVRAIVNTEISQLDPAVSVQGTPGLLTRRAETQVNVRSGETIVISGLLSAENSKDIDRLPGIGKLPIIGSLFRSNNTRNSVSELVIFVTPEVIEPYGQSQTSREKLFYKESEKLAVKARGSLHLMD